MNKKKRDKSRQFVNKTKPKALFLRHTIKLHIFAKDKLHLGIACKQACIYALDLHYLCKKISCILDGLERERCSSG